jgi:tRNA(Ile2) C34 agmatinyltransferase TiaS
MTAAEREDVAIATAADILGGKVIGVEPTKDVADARYRAGLCIDCGTRPHSAGRPRCKECHRILNVMARYET